MNTKLINFLIKLKNASLSKKEYVVFEFNTFHYTFVKILYEEGYLQSFSVDLDASGKRVITVTIRYYYNKPVFKYLKILSKPSHQIYMKISDISKIVDRRFVFFFSTNKGILTNLSCKKLNVGGKLLFMC